MNVIYLGKYRKRFDPIIEHIRSFPAATKVLEPCFGDIYIASFCRKAGYAWIGLDLNSNFVATAQRRGFNARRIDLTSMDPLPQADLCVMMGSLYHFHAQLGEILFKMLEASPNVIISEPIRNLSAQRGVIGMLAKKAANAGKGHEIFRYDRNSLLRVLDHYSIILGYHITGVYDYEKDLVVRLRKK